MFKGDFIDWKRFGADQILSTYSIVNQIIQIISIISKMGWSLYSFFVLMCSLGMKLVESFVKLEVFGEVPLARFGHTITQGK